jgi:hypothetical protein
VRGSRHNQTPGQGVLEKNHLICPRRVQAYKMGDWFTALRDDEKSRAFSYYAI